MSFRNGNVDAMKGRYECRKTCIVQEADSLIAAGIAEEDRLLAESIVDEQLREIETRRAAEVRVAQIQSFIYSLADNPCRAWLYIKEYVEFWSDRDAQTGGASDPSRT